LLISPAEIIYIISAGLFGICYLVFKLNADKKFMMKCQKILSCTPVDKALNSIEGVVSAKRKN